MSPPAGVRFLDMAARSGDFPTCFDSDQCAEATLPTYLEQGGRNMKEWSYMKRTLAVSLLALTIAFAPGAAVAKGCITGAMAGGVAGYWSGHGTLTGAVVGCMTGHTAHKVHARMRERAAQQRAQEQARRAQPRVTEVGTAAAPGHVHSVHNGTTYMYMPPQRSHTHKLTPEGRAVTGE